jgi:hypothetical protein
MEFGGEVFELTLAAVVIHQLLAEKHMLMQTVFLMQNKCHCFCHKSLL